MAIAVAVQVLMFIIAAFGAFKGFKEYKRKNDEFERKNTVDRAYMFLELRKRFKETDNFALILEYLDGDNPALETVEIADRLKFLGFLEEVALMVNSGLLDIRIANQSFGYYVIKAWGHPAMWWEGNTRDSEYRVILQWFKEECDKIHVTEESKNMNYYTF
ncbi:MAG: hypothetical protein EP322_00605 [Bacteroidetes bacterium]|nr:MAG: hypothetical protein EP322_00605 [Bacteroidota bacterium]